MAKSTSVAVTLFPGYILVFIVFLLLKVFGYVDWSWWVVTSPLWIGWAIAFTLFLGILLFTGFIALVICTFEWISRR